MRKIDKRPEPESLRQFKRRRPHSKYTDLSDVERQDIRKACAEKQFYLCAYCCASITGNSTDTRNEHVEARDLAPKRSLDFSNIVASCTTPRQCDAAHKAQPLPLTPLMPQCETDLQFKLSGRVAGLTDAARETIRVLNLGDSEANNKALIERRKQLIDSLIWRDYGGAPQELMAEEDETLAMLIDDLVRPQNGRLEAYSPVLVNILRALVKPQD